MIAPLWDEVPALVVPMPLMMLIGSSAHSTLKFPPALLYTVLVLDRDYMAREQLPSLAQQHLRDVGGVDYDLAVVNTAGRGSVYSSAGNFEPRPEAAVDATADLFQVRTQEFAQLAADIRRFTMALTAPSGAHTVTAFARAAAGDMARGDQPARRHARDGP